MTDIHLTH
jgi:hypothetical protein